MLKVYITDLASYNSGALIGEWFSLPCDEEELTLKIKQILTLGAKAVGDTIHEELFITDYDWEDVNLFAVDEYEDIYKLNSNLGLIEDATSHNLKAIKFLLENGMATNVEDAVTKSDDVIIHELTDMTSIAYDLMEELYGVDKLPSIISNNIDYEAIGRDLEIDGNYFVIDDDVYEYVG